MQVMPTIHRSFSSSDSQLGSRPGTASVRAIRKNTAREATRRPR
jgi:hypothetical protein